MKNEGGLRKSGKRIEVSCIVEELIAERYLALLPIMENRNPALCPPLGDPFGTKRPVPELVESKGRREQNETIHFLVAGCVQCRQISSEAGTNKYDWLLTDQAFNQLQLPGDGELLKSAFGKIRYLNGKIQVTKLADKKASFPGVRAGGKPVEIEDTQKL